MPQPLFRKVKFLHFGLLITLITAALYSYDLLLADKKLYLMGETSHGHYQIELMCKACHSKAFAGPDALQEACMNCHSKELIEAKDTHPKSKFTDPRNAPLLTSLDARSCITCHQEHRPEITRPMGVTLANDFCFHCHQDIEEDVPSHIDFTFDSCASAGCHNFHDNRGLYEDFLAKHIGEPDILPQPFLKTLNHKPSNLKLRSATQADWQANDQHIADNWQKSLHAHKEVNCSNCHQDASGRNITDPVALSVHSCEECHSRQTAGFYSGRHGMRIAQNQPPMTPANARAPMHTDSHHKPLNCASCHDPHSTDTRFAAVDACLGCHADEHSLAFKNSPHFDLWQQEIKKKAAQDSGVSCASCHLPRKTVKESGKTTVFAEHNQNDNLRPNEKMLRSVCINCHGVTFSLQALSDPSLIQSNFKGTPQGPLKTMEMVKKRFHKKTNTSTSNRGKP